MKAAIGIFVFVLILGVLYGLAYVGVIPAQKIADGNPSALPILKALRLAKSKPAPKPMLTAALPSPPVDPAKNMAAEQASLDAEKTQLDAERSQIAASQAQAAAPQTGSLGADQHQKLIGIYSTMGPDDLANILAHISDREAVQDLASLDEKKAGKVLAALPPARAARLSELMTGVTPPTQSAPPRAGAQPRLKTPHL